MSRSKCPLINQKMEGTSQHPLFDSLKAIWEDLASPNHSVVRAGAAKLHALVEEEADSLFHRGNAVNLHSKALPKYIETQLETLLTKPETRMGGILAMEELCHVEFVDVSVRMNLFHTMLVGVIHDTSPASREAARVWGVNVDCSCGMATELVDKHLTRCLDALHSDNLSTHRRFVGSLMIQEIAPRISSAVLLAKFDDLLKGLWNALKDSLDHTRIAAAAALRKCIDVVVHSADPAAAETWFDSLLATCGKLISQQKQKEPAHGGLLAFNAWLQANASSQRVIHVSPARVKELFLLIVQQLQKPSQYTEIRLETTTAIPLMAKFDRGRFVELCLTDFVTWAGTCYRNVSGPDERSFMFTAIGQLASVLSDKVPVFIDRVMAFIEGSLTRKGKRERCPEALSCFAMIAAADSKSARVYLRTIINSMFACTPTVDFARDIASICKSFPEMRSHCMEKLLELTRVQFSSVKSSRSAVVTANEEDTKTLLNGLRVLDSLDFGGYSTLSLLTDTIVRYLQDPHEVVRRTAVSLCVKLVHCGCSAPGSPCRLDSQGAMVHQGQQHIRLVLQVVRALINSAVADPEGDIRLSTIEQLTEVFDQVLSLQDCVRALFPALNDKHQNRLAAIHVLGRLAKRNPACVHPMLRRVLLQCVTEMHYFSIPKKQEQSTWVLSAVIEAAPVMAKPYVASLLSDTVDRLKSKHATADNVPQIQTALLRCVARLVCFTDEIHLATVRDVRAIVVSHILDSSYTPKKQVAIHALGEIVRATRDTSVYEHHPELLRVLLSALHGGFKEPWPLRHDVLRLMGIIGAVDPVKVKNVGRIETLQKVSASADAATLVRFRSDEAAAHTTMRAIMDVMDLPTNHDEVCLLAIQALVLVCTSREIQLHSLIACLPKVVPSIIQHIHVHSKLRAKLFRELTTLCAAAKHHIRGHLVELLECVKRFLPGSESDVLGALLLLLIELRHSLNEEFKPFLRVLLPLLVLAAHEDTTRNAVKVFGCCVAFGKLMDGHLHIVLPCIVEIASCIGAQHHTRVCAVNSITSFAKHLTSLSDHAARCVHCLCRMLQEPLRTSSVTEKEERDQLSHQAMTALLAIAQNLGSGFSKFSPIVTPIIVLRFGSDPKTRHVDTYRHIVDEAVRLGRMICPEPPRPVDDQNRFAPPQVRRQSEAGANKFQAIRTTLLPVERTGEEEWKQWLRQFAIELLRCSPCQAHGFALPLANIHEPFARQLCHPAFAACYAEMDDACRTEVVLLLTNVLKSPRLPSEVLQELLNLSEFLERCDGSASSPNSRGARSSAGGLFDISTLIDRSEKCSLHAKALHYLEVQFTELTREYERGLMQGRISPISGQSWQQLLSTAEKSIYLCNLLGQHESANGILKYIKDHFSRLTGGSDKDAGFTVLDAELLEKLQWWSQSLKAYQERLKVDPSNIISMRGVMVAMDAQGEYTKLLEAYKTFSRRIGKKEAAELAPMGARAAWSLQCWDDMESITQLIRTEGYQGTTATFYNAVIAVHKRDFRAAQGYISKCLRELDADLSALVAESYDRAYELFVGNQQLVELEEIMEALREPSSMPRWKELWEKRLASMAYDGWQGTLATHSLVLPYDEELAMWIQFVALCRSKGREKISSEVLSRLLGGKKIADAIASAAELPKPLVALAALTHTYEVGKPQQAVALLKQYVEKVETKHAASGRPDDAEEFALCRARLAEWTATLNANTLCFDRPLADEVLRNIQRATELDPSNGSTWHSWARMHHDMAVKTQNSFGTLELHVTCALDGYLRSIGLQQHLQDVLGFLSLWFAYGHFPAVEQSGVIKCMLQVNPNVWLRVIPQIIARIYTPNTALNEQVHTLLSAIAKAHPQALLYTLNVSGGVGFGGSQQLGPVNTTHDVSERRRASQRVLARIAELHHHGSQLVSEATMICHELVRCAVLWTELWYDELDRAWGCWGREKDPQVVWQIIEPLIRLLERPETLAEHHFVAEFGPHLDQAAKMICDAASMSGHRPREMEDAWNIFKSCIEKIDKQIESMSSLAMQLVSPRLLQSGRNLLIVVPGQYPEKDGAEYPRIASFNATLKVMSSKQHPRRISLLGSDGATYKFLLKGHEDLRLDERVMQLLGLCNTVLAASPTTNGTDCFVQTFSVTPLSDNAGLVGWVDHCDTLHQIIKDHRVHAKQLSAELAVMRAFCDDLARLTVMQHVEPFEHALESTEGNDLSRSLWIRSPSAETWLDRRTTYVRTLATMSMVGHILGLGDRHPSNLMIHAFTGRVVHIDFGDCFEVAQLRSAFPERVPFRLTRMLVKAMEMGGIEGLYRHGCVSVMSVLREERGSLLAMLEAFLHDPLISWWRDEDTNTAHTRDEASQSLQRAMKDTIDVGSFSTIVERSVRRRTISSVRGGPGSDDKQTKKAQKVLNRIKEKLNGKEYVATDLLRSSYASKDGLSVEDQVARLIQEATSNENLCQHFPGWCPFW